MIYLNFNDPYGECNIRFGDYWELEGDDLQMYIRSDECYEFALVMWF